MRSAPSGIAYSIRALSAGAIIQVLSWSSRDQHAGAMRWPNVLSNVVEAGEEGFALPHSWERQASPEPENSTVGGVARCVGRGRPLAAPGLLLRSYR